MPVPSVIIMIVPLRPFPAPNVISARPATSASLPTLQAQPVALENSCSVFIPIQFSETFAAIMAMPDRMGAGKPMPMGPCQSKDCATWATTSATGCGSAFLGVLIRVRSASNCPVVVSTGAPLMPDPPTSIPRMCMIDLRDSKIIHCTKNRDGPQTCPYLWLFLLPMTRHERFHTMQGFLDLAVFRGIADSGKAAAAGTKCVTGYHGHMFFDQQFLGKGLIVHARGLDVGERVERAARLKGAQTEAVESRDQKPAAAVIFRDHFLHVRIPALQGLERRILGSGRRG